MANHTPGPWEVDDCGNICGQGSALAQVFGAEDFPCLPEEDYDDVNLECAANARLIAAAPDLLAACRAIIAYADKTKNCNVCGCGHLDHAQDCPIDDCRAAIAKAAAKGA